MKSNRSFKGIEFRISFLPQTGGENQKFDLHFLVETMKRVRVCSSVTDLCVYVYLQCFLFQENCLFGFGIEPNEIELKRHEKKRKQFITCRDICRYVQKTAARTSIFCLHWIVTFQDDRECRIRSVEKQIFFVYKHNVAAACW